MGDKDEAAVRLEGFIQRAGELIGTDPELRNHGCITVALDWLERLTADVKESVNG